MILVCGEALYDVFFAKESDTGFLLDARIGGSAFNVAVGLARLGRQVGLFTGVSGDRTGRKLVEALRREGVETAFLAQKEAHTTLALVELTEGGSARYTFLGEGAADRLVEPADVPDLERVEALVFGCFSLLTVPTGDTFLGLAQHPRPLKVLDPNIRASVAPDMALWRERVAAFARHADVVKASAEDLASLYPDEDAAAVARRWLEDGAALVALTSGSEGARLLSRALDVSVPAERIEVVDTVGAGDTFLAALLTALWELGRGTRETISGLEEAEAERVARFAVAAAGATCTRRGADGPQRSALPAL